MKFYPSACWPSKLASQIYQGPCTHSSSQEMHPMLRNHKLRFMFTAVQNWSQFRGRRVQSTLTYSLFKNNSFKLLYHICLGLARGLFLSGLTTKILCTYISPQACYMHCPIHALFWYGASVLRSSSLRKIFSVSCIRVFSPLISNINWLFPSLVNISYWVSLREVFSPSTEAESVLISFQQCFNLYSFVHR